MQIIGTDISEKEQKAKKTMKMILISLIILLIVSIILFVCIYILTQQQFKFIVDGKRTTATNGLFLYEGDDVYISIKDISSIIGYKYYNGGYKQYTEDLNKCYIENDNEVCTFEEGSNKIYKTPKDKIDYEYYTIDENIKNINGKLYISVEGISVGCNIKIQYSKEENRISINTLPYIANYYTQTYVNSAVATNFKNQKALLYDLMIVQNIENTDKEGMSANNKNIRYGIYTVDGKEIVGTKYTNIEFIESTQEFLVTTIENKVGIITAEGDTKVSPQYDDLKQIDKDLNLYLATNNNKKGIIEKNGKILIYLEYDEIGIDTTQFQTNDIKNGYILFNNAIPVKQNGKWGLYNIKGNIILPLEYDGLGSIAGKSTDKTLNNILLIPDIKGIVVSKIYESEDKKKTTLYGIVNYIGKELVPTALTTIYSVTNNGRDEYTMINNGTSYDVIEYANKYLKEKLNEEEVKTDINNEIDEILTNDLAINNTNTNILTNQI